MRITTEGGTVFTVVDGNVTITRSDQPEITIPEDDLEEYFDRYADLIADDLEDTD